MVDEMMFSIFSFLLLKLLPKVERVCEPALFLSLKWLFFLRTKLIGGN